MSDAPPTKRMKQEPVVEQDDEQEPVVVQEPVAKLHKQEGPQFLIVDTETTDFNGYVISLAYVRMNEPSGAGSCSIMSQYKEYLKTKPGIEISPGAYQKHKISSEHLSMNGLNAAVELEKFFDTARDVINNDGKLVFHNAKFDVSAINRTAVLFDVPMALDLDDTLCTMLLSTNFVKLPGKYGNYKWPKNTELFGHLFPDEKQPDDCDLHDALVDALITHRSFVKGRELEWW